MPYIKQGIEQLDGQTFTRHTDWTTKVDTSFKYSITQEVLNIVNPNQDADLTVTISGTSTVVAAGTEKTFYTVSEFLIKCSDDRSSFVAKSWVSSAKSSSSSRATELQAVASRGSHYNNGQGSELQISFKISHVAAVDCTDIALAYGNYYDNGNTPTNPINIKASLLIRGVYYPVFFNGATTTIIGEGGMIVSDPTGIFLSKGESFFSIVYINNTTGQKYPRGLVAYAERNGEGSATTDITASGATTSAGMYAYHPCAVLGRTIDPTASVLPVGDSIMTGANDYFQDQGFVTRALEEAGLPYIRVAKGGETATSMLNRNGMYRLRLAKYCTHAICNYGTNELAGANSEAVIKADLLALWNELAKFGLKVFQCTITPHTNSSDGWTTSTGQTSAPSDARSGPAGLRTTINEWIRTVPAPLTGIFDVAAAVETGLNTGKWKYPGYTADGLHPEALAHQPMKVVIDTTRLTL